MNNGEMYEKMCRDLYEKICRDRFGRLEQKQDMIIEYLSNHIPHMIINIQWRIIGVVSPFILGIIWLIIKILFERK